MRAETVISTRKSLVLSVLLSSLMILTSVAQTRDYTPPGLDNKESWTMVLIPDIQSYTKFERNQGIFDLMVAWTAEQINPLNIGLVLCVGDLVEHNNFLKGDGVNGNQSSINQWRAFDRSISRLDNRIPYIMATGNHDYGFANAENRQTFYDDYITADRNRLNEELLREYYTHPSGMPTLANAVFEFIDPQGIPYLILNLEFAPRDEVLEWAARTIAQPKYSDHRVILQTHVYMNSNSERIEWQNYPLQDANYGTGVWDKLVNESSNIVMVLAGHIGAADNPLGHLAFKREPRADGGTVTQMVFNAQALGGGWHGNGGDGWLRYMEFKPDGKTVKVRTFSPLFAISPSTRHLAWRTEPHDEFEFQIVP